MSETEDAKRERLALLLFDVLAGDPDELSALRDYARDPGSLSAERRVEIERRVAESPALADQLRVLRRVPLG